MNQERVTMRGEIDDVRGVGVEDHHCQFGPVKKSFRRRKSESKGLDIIYLT